MEPQEPEGKVRAVAGLLGKVLVVGVGLVALGRGAAALTGAPWVGDYVTWVAMIPGLAGLVIWIEPPPRGDY